MPKHGNFGHYEGETLEVEEWRDIESLLDTDITVHEKIDRPDGQHGPYQLLKVTTMENPDAFFGVSTGAQVVMKKVEAAVLDGALPCDGHVMQPEGKDYFDLIAPKGKKK